jgi:hypothetical protein
MKEIINNENNNENNDNMWSNNEYGYMYNLK